MVVVLASAVVQVCGCEMAPWANNQAGEGTGIISHYSRVVNIHPLVIFMYPRVHPHVWICLSSCRIHIVYIPDSYHYSTRLLSGS